MENIVFNEVWGFDIAVEMTFLAIASFATLFALLAYREGRLREALIGAAVAAVLPVFSLIILNLHLLKPEASYLLFLSPQPRSWMVYGGIGMTSLIVLSAVFALLLLSQLARLPLIGRLSPLAANSALMNAVGILMVLAGAFVALYTGLLMSYERGIPFWHSAAIPAIAFLMGLTGGSSLYSLITPQDRRVSLALISSLSLLLVIYLAHLLISLLGSPAANVSAKTVLDSGLFQVSLLLALLAIVGLAANLYFRTRYIPIVAGLIGIFVIFALRLLLLEAGAWELPVV
ncbi:MAG: polysulfide reductase NrfD [Acidilobaceae archaeon]|nr:polysulfide reductase NrfD [Acidilobaceae archaeon]